VIFRIVLSLREYFLEVTSPKQVTLPRETGKKYRIVRTGECERTKSTVLTVAQQHSIRSYFIDHISARLRRISTKIEASVLSTTSTTTRVRRRQDCDDDEAKSSRFYPVLLCDYRYAILVYEAYSSCRRVRRRQEFADEEKFDTRPIPPDERVRRRQEFADEEK